MPSYTFSQLFDFTRTTSGTFVGSNGLIQTTPASVNLLTFTQEFDNNSGWAKAGTAPPTVTANTTTAPDGTSTADSIFQQSASGSATVSQTGPTATIGLAYTFSCYLKAGTSRFVQLTFSAGSFGSTQYANIDLQSGTVSQSAGSPTVVITVSGDGWYRVAYTATATAAAAASPFIILINSGTDARAPTITGSSSNFIYVWGAQLEQASAATTYTRNYGGLFPPRFDYDPVTLAGKGLLIEEQRSNLLLRSEEFDNASWVKSGATITANSTTSPSGTATADTLTEDTSTGGHITYQLVTVSNATVYTFTVYAKPNGRTLIDLTFAGAGSATYNISTGVVTSTIQGTAGIQPAGNGWYRCSITFTSGTTSYNAQIRLVSTGTTTSYTGDGTSGVYIWGAQLEAGAFATSYIPTVASQVTRTADIVTIQAPMFGTWYNQTQGTFVAEFSGPAGYAVAVNDGTNNNYSGIVYNSATTIRGVSTVGGIFQGVTMNGAAAGAVNRTAYGYQAANLGGSTNGGAVATNTAAAIPTVTQLIIGSYGSFAFLNGYIRSVRFYPVRLTNAQLQALSA